YTREFMHDAEPQIQKMQRIFMVQRFEVEPVVFLKVTDNWVELTLRYLVDPKKRRAASTYIFTESFRQIRERQDIQIGSSTMNLTIQQASGKESADMQKGSMGKQDVRREDGNKAA
ncbi:MAG TPA: hypothetical protein VHV32_09595, partial [Candidatus Angelobacter sp.]|nr:hypothetical protein [Candidatus Angelobacter sp.]